MRSGIIDTRFMESPNDIAEKDVAKEKQTYIDLSEDEMSRLVEVVNTGSSSEKEYKKEEYFKLVEEQGIDIEGVRNELLRRDIDATKVVLGGALFIKDYENDESDKLRGDLSLASIAAMIDLDFNVSVSVYPKTDAKFLEKLEAIKSSGNNRLRIAIYDERV